MSEKNPEILTPEEITVQRMYDIFDEIAEASQDPDNHPAFAQLRKHLREGQLRRVSAMNETTPRIRTPEEAQEMRENLRQVEAMGALEGLPPSLELRELTERIIRGEVTSQEGFEQMKNQLMEKHNITSQTE
jgi:hypothetical protein